MTRKFSLINSKLRGALEQLPYLPRILALVWTAARRWTIVWFGLLIVQGLLPVASVYLVRALVDSLVEAIGAGGDWEALLPTLILVALVAGIMLLGELLRGVTGWVRAAQAELVKDYVSRLVHDKATAVDLAFYESPDYYDLLHRVRLDAQNRPVNLLENVGGLIQNGLTLVAMGAVLIPYSVWLPGALLVSTLPAFFVVLDYTLRQHEWRQRVTPVERKVWYYDWLLTARETAAELRLFQLGQHFKESYQGLRRRLRDEKLRLARQQGLAELAAGGMALLVTGLALAWMLWRAVQGHFTLGDLALFYQAFNQGQRLMRSLLESLGQIYGNSLFLSNLFAFLALEPKVVDPPHPTPAPQPLRKGIVFKDVAFFYPGSEKAALRHFNLTLNAGQIAAIVGANGAGKSTLIKLLCRLYEPDAGQILLDDTPVQEIALQELWGMITVLFQQPVHYNATAAHNIALGDLAAQPDMEAIREAARLAGADAPIGRLPQEYETLLGKWFAGGYDLSVGEWQRIALARAFLRQAPLILLDEPTSAMDSWAEADWLRRFRRLAAGRTAVIITHRFTTAMRADLIYVMDEGQIVESGSHQELLALNGRYARSWRAQVEDHAR